MREVSLSLLKETLELRIWLHDFGATDVLRVLGVLVRGHATASAPADSRSVLSICGRDVTAISLSPIRAPRRETSLLFP